MSSQVNVVYTFLTSDELATMGGKQNDNRRVVLDKPGIVTIDVAMGVYPGPTLAARLDVDFSDGRVASAPPASKACQDFVTNAFLAGKFVHGNLSPYPPPQ